MKVTIKLLQDNHNTYVKAGLEAIITTDTTILRIDDSDREVTISTRDLQTLALIAQQVQPVTPR